MPETFHVITRGNNRSAVFHDEEDYISYLNIVRECDAEYGLSIYHFCLMPNHVHLVISPEKDDGLPDIMHDINLNYSRYHKKRYGRIGRLWQGNYRKYLIDTYEYLLTCGIYVELNPVRASLCETPGEYRWSSHRFYISQSEWDFLEKSPNFLCMGQDDEERGMNYKGLTDVWLSNPTTRHEVKKLFIEGAVRFHPMFEK